MMWPIIPSTTAPLLLFTLNSAWLLLFVPFRLAKLGGSSIKILPGHPGWLKILLSFLFLISELSYLVSFSASGYNLRNIQTVLSFPAALGVCLLSFLEHRRSVHASSGVSLYLLVASFQATTWDFRFESGSNIRLLIIVALLLAENQSKRAFLRPQYHHLSPEETEGVLGRTFFWWINPVLIKGYERLLVGDDLPPVDAELLCEALMGRMLVHWNGRAKPESTKTLPIALLQCLRWPFIYAIAPRLFLIGFRYSQAILISVAIRFINHHETGIKEQTEGPIKRSIRISDPQAGVSLIFFAAIVYVGMAVSTAIYQHKINRIKLMIRGALTQLIYHRSLNVSVDAYESANAVTLMSSDVGSLEAVGEMLHETWAQLLEVIIGTFMMASQIGWLCLIPLFIIFLGSRMSRYVARNLKGKQNNWSIATQQRIAMTASVLGSAKSMKMLGLAETATENISSLRDNEIEMSKRIRWMNVAYNASANAIGIFSPVITLVLFAILCHFKGNRTFTSERVFTTTALLGLVTHPANMIMTIIPRAVAALANFERVQKYLLEASNEDHRIEQKMSVAKHDSLADIHQAQPAIILDQVSISYPDAKKPALQNITMQINKGSIVMCSGSVGSGKSTLAKAILGEVAPSSGTISVASKRMAYCSQSPWLPSGTIKQVICGSKSAIVEDSAWYRKVLHACDLLRDLEMLPNGDKTEIGSRGINLSGGQRQRVALARAIYARCDFIVLDDTFSALDGKTENFVNKLLCPDSRGIFRHPETTVFMITHSAQHFHLADHIVVLGNSTIQSQGTPDELKNILSNISKTAWGESHGSKGFSQDPKAQSRAQTVDDAALDITRKTGDTALYSYYLKSIGTVNILVLLFCTSSYSFGITYSQYWLKLWAEATSRIWFYITGYIILCFLAWSTTSVQMWSTAIKIAPHSGKVLHEKLLSAIVGAPLSYYSTTDIGTILNHFSQDIRLVDVELATALNNVIVQAFKLIVQIILLLAVQTTLAITLPFCIIVVFIVQKIYLRTSRQLRFLELESRSALYSSFLETVEGLSTIRAFGWQDDFQTTNTAQLDISQRPFYTLLCLQRWLNIVLDLIIAVIAVGIIWLAIATKDTSTGASIGVSLNLILVANTTLLKLVENWTGLEISLGAISRLKSAIEETPQENKTGEDLIPPAHWPSAGRIEMHDVTVSYNSHSTALAGISLKITAGQKVVICGRTGSGKSTLLLTLLHLLDLQSGSIEIDGIDIARIPRSILRQQAFIAVPQDPFIVSNRSARSNLDPSGLLSDQAVFKALEKTELWYHFAAPLHNHEYEDVHILDIPMSAYPSLSTGQMQLFSLCRALLRRASACHSTTTSSPKPILLLDEATSSLDLETEKAIQDIIREEFTERGHTVIVVAHRVEAAITGMRGGDAVVKMCEGRVESVSGVGDSHGDIGSEP